VRDLTDISVFDAATLTLRRRLEGWPEQINTIEFSHDGTLLAAGTDQGTVVVWDVVAGTRGAELHGDAGSTRGLAFSPDDAILYSASNRLLVWDLRGDRRLIGVIARAEPGDSSSELAVPAPDGKAVAYFDSTVRSERGDTIQFRDVTTGELGDPIATGHSNWGADWRPPDGEQFATAEGDGFVRVWDWRRGNLIVERKVAQGYVGGIAYTHDGQRIVVGERSGAVFQVDAETLRPVGDRIELDRRVRDVFAAPDGSTVLVLLSGDAYAVIDLVEGNVVHRDDLGVDPAWLDVSPDGTRLAVGATTGEVGVIDLGSGEWVRPPIDAHGGWVQRWRTRRTAPPSPAPEMTARSRCGTAGPAHSSPSRYREARTSGPPWSSSPTVTRCSSPAETAPSTPLTHDSRAGSPVPAPWLGATSPRTNGPRPSASAATTKPVPLAPSEW
jgi:WD40 repeat protein